MKQLRAGGSSSGSGGGGNNRGASGAAVPSCVRGHLVAAAAAAAAAASRPAGAAVCAWHCQLAAAAMIALCSSIDNSRMTSYKRTAGLTTADIEGATSRHLTRERKGGYPEWDDPLRKPRQLHPPHRTPTTNQYIARSAPPQRPAPCALFSGHASPPRCCHLVRSDYNRPIMNLTNRDIIGSWPTSNFVSSRHTNPLEPDYPLPVRCRRRNQPNSRVGAAAPTQQQL